MIFKNRQHGFTLVEIIVSMAIFIVVAVVALGALLKIIDANKKSESIKSLVTNLNFALDSMARDIRVGSHYICADPESSLGDPGVTDQPFVHAALSNDPASADYYPPTPCNPPKLGRWVFAFNSSKVDTAVPNCHLIHAYYFSGFSLYKAEQTACNGTYTFYPIIYGAETSNDTNQDETQVNFGTSPIRVVTGGTSQPYVQIRLTGTSNTKKKLTSSFDIQTTISQRIND